MLRSVAIILMALMLQAPLHNALAQGSDAEITFWNSIRDSTDVDEFRAYLESFPDGAFAPLARVRIRKLSDGGEISKSKSDPKQKEQPAAGEPGSTSPEKDIGYVGVRVSNLNAEQARRAGLDTVRGARLEEVVAKSPADRAGLIKEDVVVKVDAVPVANILEFLEQTKRLKPGQTARFEVMRSGRTVIVPVTAGGFVADNLAAATGGDTRAMLWLYGIYVGDRLGSPDVGKAMRWLNAAVDGGDAAAQHTLASLYWQGTHVSKDRHKAKGLFQKSADRGHAPAADMMGRILYSGLVGEKDRKRALSYFRQAADAGSSAMMHQVGYMYLNGEGVAKNAEEAVRWYRKSAEAGYANAMADLAVRYHTGNGVAQDHARAAIWYDRALEAGNKSGLYNMSLLYANGQGVEKNDERAAGHFVQALMEGDTFALKQIKTNASGWSKGFRRHIQKLLTEQGVYDGRIDGSIGPQSRRSIDDLFERSKTERDRAAAASGSSGSGDASTSDPLVQDDQGLGSWEDLGTLD